VDFKLAIICVRRQTASMSHSFFIKQPHAGQAALILKILNEAEHFKYCVSECSLTLSCLQSALLLATSEVLKYLELALLPAFEHPNVTEGN
jgi:hypothetical protein